MKAARAVCPHLMGTDHFSISHANSIIWRLVSRFVNASYIYI